MIKRLAFRIFQFDALPGALFQHPAASVSAKQFRMNLQPLELVQ